MSAARLVHRELAIENLDMSLRRSESIVSFVGPLGSGKTTLLREFRARDEECHLLIELSRRAKNGFSLPALVAAVSDALLQAGASRDSIPEQNLEPAVALHRMLRGFASHRRIDGRFAVCAIDGLDELEDTELSIALQVFDALPLNTIGLKFVVAVAPDTKLEAHLAANDSATDLRAGWLSAREVAEMLSDENLRDEDCRSIHHGTGGLASSVRLARELLVRGTVPTSVAAVAARGHEHLVDALWPTRREDEDIVAILAFAGGPLRAEEIAISLSVEPEVASMRLGQLPLLGEDSIGRWFVADPAIWQYARRRLAPRRSEVSQMLLESAQSGLLAKGHDTHGYLVHSGLSAELISFLTPAVVAQHAEKTSSTAEFFNLMQSGLSASAAQGELAVATRLSLQSALAMSTIKSASLLEEARARAALGDSEFAIGLATAATRSEVAMQFLAIALRARTEGGLPRDPELHTEVAKRIEQLPEKLEDSMRHRIANDLFVYDATLAFAVLSATRDTDGSHSLDWDMARLAMSTLSRSGGDGGAFSREDVASRFEDEDAKTLTIAIGFVSSSTAETSAPAVIAVAKRLGRTEHRIFLARQWMTAHREAADAYTVLEYALEEALAARDYSLTAAHVRELSLCLPYTSQLQAASHLTQRIDAQRDLLRANSPLEDVVRLHCLLARSEWQYDRTASVTRLDSLALDIEKEQSAEVRVVCFARLLSATRLLNDSPVPPEIAAIGGLAEGSLRTTALALVKDTALHVDRLRHAVCALAPSALDVAASLIDLANTAERKDELRRLLILEASQYRAFVENPIALAPTFASIADSFVRDGTIGEFTTKLRRRRTAQVLQSGARWLLDAVRKIAPWEVRLRASVDIGVFLRRAGHAELANDADAIAAATWDAGDQGWYQLELGFDLLASCAKWSPELAAKLAVYCDTLKPTLTVASRAEALALRRSLLLANRLVGAFAKDHSEAAVFLDRVKYCANQIGRRLTTASVLADLCLRCRDAGLGAEAQLIAETSLIPMLAAEKDPVERERLLVVVGPALAVTVFPTLAVHLSSASEQARARVVSGATRFLVYGVVPGDPLDTDGLGRTLSFDNCCAVLELLERCSEDSTLYFALEELANSFAVGNPQNLPSRVQRNELALKVRELARKKLPAKGYLSHDGYLLVSLAQAERISAQAKPETIQSLLKRADGIPNLSDRVYVRSILGALLPSNERLRIGRACQLELESLPSLDEQVSRMQVIADQYNRAKEVRFAKGVLEAAYHAVSGLRAEEEAEDRRRRLLSLAFRVDPKLAEALSTATDSDPAKDQAQRLVAVFQLRDALTSRKQASVTAVETATLDDIARASWMQLGSLLASRSNPLTARQIASALPITIGADLDECYPVLALACESIVRRMRNGGDVSAVATELAHSLLDSTERALATARGDGSSAQRKLSELADDLTGGVVGNNGRDAGLAIIGNWLRAQTSSRITIVDRYFDAAGLQLLQLILDASPTSEVQVVLGKSTEAAKTLSDADSVRENWYRVYVGDMPVTTFYVMETEVTGQFPFHGRFILSDGGRGLSLGQSQNGIGRQYDLIQEMEDNHYISMRDLVSWFQTRPRKEFLGERVKVVNFQAE